MPHGTSIEHWNLYLDRTYHLSVWPWAGRTWETLTDKDVEFLPQSNSDFTRVAPYDGVGMQVPAGLPRELPMARTRFAVYQDGTHLSVFLQADRPPVAIAGLEDAENEALMCVFLLEGHNRGVYFGFGQDGLHISVPRIYDPLMLTPDDYLKWPWDEYRKNAWGRLANYEARMFRSGVGITAAWRIPRTTVDRGFDGSSFRFTIARNCQRTNELLAWATPTTWEPRSAGEFGRLVLTPPPYDPVRPRVNRVDLAYDRRTESGSVKVTWKDLWSNPILQKSPDGKTIARNAGGYEEFISLHTLAVNGEESTKLIDDVTEHRVQIAEGINCLEVISDFAPPLAVHFNKRSGHRIVPKRDLPPEAEVLPSMAELVERFNQFHELTELKYKGGGIWGEPAGRGVHNVSHNGSFAMEPYALFCLYGERREIYVERIREFCDRALLMQHPDGWFSDLAVDGTNTPFAGGGFDTGAAGEGLALGYRVTGDKRYFDAAHRVFESYGKYRTEINQNYAAFPIWHLTELFKCKPDPAYIERAAYYAQHCASRAIDIGGAQDGHNYYASYGGITLKGLAKLLKVLPSDHPYYPKLRHQTIRMANHCVAIQQQTGRFPERNRAYLGFHSINPLAGLVATAEALGPEDGAALEPAIRAAYLSAETQEFGLVAGMIAMWMQEM